MSQPIKVRYEWKTVPWRKAEKKVFKLQKRIYRASQRSDVRTMRRLQRLLLKSSSVRLLAVRKVTQLNRGKRTPGVDSKNKLNQKERMQLVMRLNLSEKSSLSDASGYPSSEEIRRDP